MVRWLEDSTGALDSLTGVTRESEFDAWFGFEETGQAEALAAAIQSEATPAPMQEALEALTVDGAGVRVRFTPVDEVQLTRRAPDHEAACVLDPPSA